MIAFGFTGTKKGMTPQQAGTVLTLFKQLSLEVLHHGWCIGSDAQAHKLARAWANIRIVGHPPLDERFKAMDLVCDEVRPAFPYLVRDRHVVAEGTSGLIAAPKDFIQPTNLRGQGTWTTIGYAHQARRPIWIVYPDGTYREEPPA